MNNTAMQMDLFQQVVERPPLPPIEKARPSLDLVKTEPRGVSEEQTLQTYQGCSNSATWCADLYLQNDYKARKNLERLFVEGRLTAKEVEAQFKALNQPLDEWVEGKVNWEEIARGLDDNYKEEIAEEDIPQDALGILAMCAIEGTVVKLPCQLKRELYEQVNRILVAMGGKWNKKAKAHLFEEDPTDLLDAVILTGKVKKPEKFGYFPTPQPLAEAVVAMARIEEGMLVGEPEAGQGGLADEIAKLAGGKEFVICYELQEKNVKVLREKGYAVTQCDFLTLPDSQRLFDRIVMNPPFERQQDVIHVQKAWNFLRPGGRLTSIMSPGFTFRSDKRSIEFREFVKEYGHYVNNPEGSFKPSGTNINTVTVVLDKP